MKAKTSTFIGSDELKASRLQVDEAGFGWRNSMIDQWSEETED
jgi:hypothetical protein